MLAPSSRGQVCSILECPKNKDFPEGFLEPEDREPLQKPEAPVLTQRCLRGAAAQPKGEGRVLQIFRVFIVRIEISLYKRSV